MARRYRATTLNIAAVAAALAVAMLFAVIPVYGGDSSETLIEHEGTSVLLVVLVPALVAAVPLALPPSWRRGALLVAATIAVLFVLVTGFTVGLFFLPTAVLLVLAVRRAGAEHD